MIGKVKIFIVIQVCEICGWEFLTEFDKEKDKHPNPDHEHSITCFCKLCLPWPKLPHGRLT